MLKTKFKDSDAIYIPPKIAKKFALKEGHYHRNKG